MVEKGWVCDRGDGRFAGTDGLERISCFELWVMEANVLRAGEAAHRWQIERSAKRRDLVEMDAMLAVVYVQSRRRTDDGSPNAQTCRSGNSH